MLRHLSLKLLDLSIDFSHVLILAVSIGTILVKIHDNSPRTQPQWLHGS